MRKEVYAEDLPDDILAGMRRNAFVEDTRFRSQMKDLEEHVLTGTMPEKGPAAGRQAKVVQRMGGRYDVMVEDPITRRSRTVASFKYDALGRRVRTDVAWTPGDPQSVAAVFGIPFVSAFGDLPRSKPQYVADDDAVEEARRKVRLSARVRRAEEQEEAKLDQEAHFRVGNKKQHQVSPSDWTRAQRHRQRRGIK